MAVDPEFKKKYPNISRELEEDSNSVSISAYRKSEEEANAFIEDPGIGYYLKKCKGKKERDELVDWYLKQGKIDKKQAAKLKKK